MEDKKTLGSLNNMGIVLHHMEDYEGALAYYQQALRVMEKVMRKTHPSTLDTIMNIAGAYMEGLKDFMKAEKITRLALDGYERSLGKDHENTKNCARNLAILYVDSLGSKVKLQYLVNDYPHVPSSMNGATDLLNT